MISIKEPVYGDNFVNRIDLLRNLHAIYPTDNVALIGPRRIGKSSVAEQFLKTLPNKNTIKFRFDVQENIGTPGMFAMRLLQSFMFSYYELFKKEKINDIADMGINPSVLVEASGELNSTSLKRLSRFLISYYPPTPDNEREVLNRIFNFMEDFSNEKGIKAVIVLDEFQDIVDLEKYKGFRKGEILAFLRGIISGQNHVWYLFTGSAVRIMIDIFGKKDSPFLGRVRQFNVTRFTKDDTLQLIYKCIEKPITSEALNLLFALSKGHPFYTVVIAGSANVVFSDSKIITRKAVEDAFIFEITRGVLDEHCRYIFQMSLEKAGSFLKEILRILTDTPLTATELSKRIGRIPGHLSIPLRTLTNLDLIAKAGKKFYIPDDILACWIRNVYGYEDIRFDVVRKKIQENYKEYFAKLTTEIGFFFESYMREMLGRFDGQTYKDIRLPKFHSVQGVNAFDHEGDVFGRPSNIEIDALCRGKENWICEFKYTKKSVKKADIDFFMKKKSFIEKKLNIQIHKMLFIAKSGFSEYAIQSDIWCMTIHELNKLLSMLNIKKLSKINFDNINET